MKKIIALMSIVSVISLFCYSLYAIITVPTADSLKWTGAETASRFPGRSGHRSVIFNNRIWVIGGWNGGDFLCDIWSSQDGSRWDLVTAEAPFGGRIGHTLTVYKNSLWLIAGITFNSSRELVDYNDVWRSSDGKTWRRITGSAPFSKRGGHSCVVFGNRLYLTGGIDRNGAEVWHTTDGINWVLDTADAGFGIRGAHSSLVFNGMIWVIGGMKVDRSNRFTPLSDVWASADGINWIKKSDNISSFGGAGTSAVVFNGRLWVIGGFRKSGTVYSSPDGTAWHQVDLSADFGERVCHETVVHRDRIWVIGGYDGRDHRDDLWYSSFTETRSTMALH